LKIVPIGSVIGSSNGWIVKATESTSVSTRVPTEPQTPAGMTQPDVSIAGAIRSAGAWIGPVRRRIAVSTAAAVRPIGVSIVARASATRARRGVTRHRSDQVGLAATSRWGSRPGRPLCVVLNYRVRRMRNAAVISRRENNGIRE
jgi:hypothetical protein